MTRSGVDFDRLALRQILGHLHHQAGFEFGRLGAAGGRIAAYARVALDDLGTGHSGLNALARIAPDFVKLDMSLVRGLQKDTGSSRLVSHLIDFSRGESIQVIAEGVETEEERDALLDTGCELMQGFLFARPGEPFPKIES